MDEAILVLNKTKADIDKCIKAVRKHGARGFVAVTIAAEGKMPVSQVSNMLHPPGMLHGVHLIAVEALTRNMLAEGIRICPEENPCKACATLWEHFKNLVAHDKGLLIPDHHPRT